MQDKESFKLNVLIGRSFSYLEYHTDQIIKASSPGVYFTPYSLIKKIEIDNDTDTGYEDLIIRISFSNSLFSAEDFHTGPISPRSNGTHKTVIRDDLKIKADEKELYALSGMGSCTIYFEVVDPKESVKVLYSCSKTIQVLPLRQPTEEYWKAMALFAKYCITDFPEMAKLHQQAIVELNSSEISGNDAPKTLIGYQNEDKKEVLKEIAAVYRALHKHSGIVYSNPPASSGIMQNVRLPVDVMKTKLGTCLDLAILFCSALLEIGLRPILVLIKGHAFAGCFLTEYDSFSNLVEEKPGSVYSDAVCEDKKLVLVECTTFAADSNVTFTEAAEIGQSHLRGYRGIFSAVDVERCQKYVYKPIPYKSESGEIDFSIKPIEMGKERLLDLEEYQGKPIDEVYGEDRFSVWEKKLLDLSTTNKLVNFSFNKSKTNYCQIPLQGVTLFDFLKEGSGTAKIKPFDSYLCGADSERMAGAALNDIVNPLLKNGTILAISHSKVIKELARKDKTSREETGSPTLYLSIGLLSAEDQGPKERRLINGPFLLIPVSISKDRYGDEYTLQYDFEDLRINKTFFEYYKLKKGVDYSSLYSVNSSHKFEDIVSSLLSMKEGDITLDDTVCFIGNFSFSHMVMWQDIVDRKDELLKNPIIRSLLENKSFIDNEDDDSEHADAADDLDFAAPLPYDSTQLRAIKSCGKGNSFILDGPPGTGKSQTIVNMIMNAFYHGKTVLFVAEKQAALEVVRQRLASLGMDRYALQLYSNSANKQSVFGQLNSVMDLCACEADDSFSEKCRQVREQKEVLNRELRSLHKRNGKFYSLYEAITHKLSNENVSVKTNFPREFIVNYSNTIDEKIRSSLEDIKRLYHDMMSLPRSKWTNCILFESYSYQDQIEAEGRLQRFKDALKEAENSYGLISTTFGLPDDPKTANLRRYFSILDLSLGLGEKINLLADPDIQNRLSEWNLAVKRMNDLAAKASALCQGWDENAIFKVDGKAILDNVPLLKNIFKKGLAKKNIANAVSPLINDCASVSSERLVEIGKLAIEANEISDQINRTSPSLISAFGRDITSDFKVSSEAQATIDGLNRVKEYIDEGSVEDVFGVIEKVASLSPFAKTGIKPKVESFGLISTNFDDSLSDLLANYALDVNEIVKDGLFEGFGQFCDWFSDTNNQKTVFDKAGINRCCKVIRDAGAGLFADKILNDSIPYDELSEVYDRALGYSFVVYHFSSSGNDYNDAFDSGKYDSEILKYQKLINEYSSLCVSETENRILSKFPNPGIARSSTSPIGILRKFAANGGRGISIRNAMKKFEDHFRTYFPCFLMSPLAAAQYLDVSSKKFDVVIFDEASQIPTSEAVGPIARGLSLVVAGDPQQMPPSNFFNANISSLDDDESGDAAANEDAESLLDDCISIDMPRIRLAFHYRSRHESLIRFSNNNFYGGDLFTFPSKDNRISRVSFVHVNAVSKKKGSDISNEEIETVTTVLKGLLDDPKTNNKSIGIIVFNSKQQAKLYDVIDEFMSKKPEYASLTHWNEELSTEKLFVKNLENVQGDERDIIIMSIGFSKGANGKASINGPLALEKGERRLNVAASRAKDQMIVLSTIFASDIDETGKKNKGAKNLKDFLMYAENASVSTLKSSEDDSNRGLSYFLAQAIMKRGYECDLSVGSSEFKIDVAVREKGKDEYLLGLLLDEKPLNPNVSCRDRFFVEPVILSSLKWKILRVYSYGFLRFPDATVNDVIERIKSVNCQSSETNFVYVPPIKSDAPKNTKEMPLGLIPYERYQFSADEKIDYSEFSDGHFHREIYNAISNIVLKEAPISLNLLKTRMKEFFGIEKMGNKATNIVLSHFKIAGVKIVYEYEKTEFVIPDKTNYSVDKFRSSDRDIMDVSRDEIVCLMNSIIRLAKNIDKEDLIRTTTDQMKIATLSSRVRGKLEYVIRYAKNNGLFIEGYTDAY